MTKVPNDDISKEMRRFLDNLDRRLNSITPAQIGAAGTSQTDFISGFVRSPANQDYRIVEKLPYAATITEVTGKTSSGTITATFKINTTAITNGALSVTSTQSSSTPTANNAAAASDALVMTLSSNSSAQNLSFTVKFTRTLVS